MMERDMVRASTHMLMAMRTRGSGRITCITVEANSCMLVDLLMKGSTRMARDMAREQGHTLMELSMRGSGRMADDCKKKLFTISRAHYSQIANYDLILLSITSTPNK